MTVEDVSLRAKYLLADTLMLQQAWDDELASTMLATSQLCLICFLILASRTFADAGLRSFYYWSVGLFCVVRVPTSTLRLLQCEWEVYAGTGQRLHIDV